MKLKTISRDRVQQIYLLLAQNYEDETSNKVGKAFLAEIMEDIGVKKYNLKYMTTIDMMITFKNIVDTWEFDDGRM